jgi:hypothetical protein
MDATITGVNQRILRKSVNGISIKQANNILEIRFDGNKSIAETNVRLMNTMGKVVVAKNVNTESRNCVLPLGKNACGVYLLQITSGNGHIETSPVRIFR